MAPKPPKKTTPRHHAPPRHHSPPRHHGARRRNADGIPDDVLLPLAPIAPPVLANQPTQAMLPYGYAPPVSRPRSRPRRAAQAIGRKAGAIASALKPEAATITKEHLLGVGANAAGGIVTALAANELVDNIGVMPMAVSATVVGGLGSAFLKGNWQKVAQGMLGAGVGQLGTAYLAQRGLKKAAQASAAAAPAAAGKRNAMLTSGDEPDDDNAMLRALDRTERRIRAMLDDERNAGGGGEVIADAGPAYADDPYGGFTAYGYGA
ncbi:MAG TPA: hypothetical protein VHE35_07490 [Kofleriaceae bacterium]|nr:hypothetical protein [Kofleriaceae bacterium]